MKSKTCKTMSKGEKREKPQKNSSWSLDFETSIPFKHKRPNSLPGWQYLIFGNFYPNVRGGMALATAAAMLRT